MDDSVRILQNFEIGQTLTLETRQRESTLKVEVTIIKNSKAVPRNNLDN